MNQQLTSGIVLKRTDFSEADRIVTMLTPDHGKLSLMARGVRRIKSKLAGGIELFSVSDITFMRGKGDVGTLISARLQTHYGQIVTDLTRVQLGYELIKLLDKVTEDQTENEYFDLLQQTFAALNDMGIDLQLIRLWFQAQLLSLAGHMPNLRTDTSANKLAANHTYVFDFDAMAFTVHPEGHFEAEAIKALRLLFSHNSPAQLMQVQGLASQLSKLQPPIGLMMNTYLHV